MFLFRPSSYTWEKQDGELPPMAKMEGAFLHFEMLNKSDNGVYLCLAENGLGNSEEEYILRVQGTHWKSQGMCAGNGWPAGPQPLLFYTSSFFIKLCGLLLVLPSIFLLIFVFPPVFLSFCFFSSNCDIISSTAFAC